MECISRGWPETYLDFGDYTDARDRKGVHTWKLALRNRGGLMDEHAIQMVKIKLSFALLTGYIVSFSFYF